MRLEEYMETEMVNENVFVDVLKKVKNKTSDAVLKMFKDSWNRLVGILQNRNLEKDALDIINKHLNTKYKSLDQISRAKMISSVMPEGIMNENFAYYWKEISAQLFPVLSFYPALKCFLELDKLLASSGDMNIRTLIVYGVFFVSLISGKYLLSWNKWRKAGRPETA